MYLKTRHCKPSCIPQAGLAWRCRSRLGVGWMKNINFRVPLSRKRCTGRLNSRVREVLGIRFHLICQSLGKMCNVAHFSIRLRCKIKSIAWFFKWNFWNDPQFLKNVTPHEKKPPWPPKKVKMRSPKKSLSSNPPWHVHFAKNQVQFGIFWPLEPHFWSTPPL